MRLLPAIVLLPLSAFASSLGAAQPQLPSSAEVDVAPEPPDVQTEVSRWESDFSRARTWLRDGQFAAAAAAFSALAERADNATRKRAALEASWLAIYWSKRGYALTLRRAEAAIPSRPDRRSTDEIALLYTSSFFYGLGSGFTLALQTQPDAAAGVVLPTLALVGLSGLVVYGYDTRVGLRYGAAQSVTSGLYIGLEEGLAWLLWYQSRAPDSKELSGETISTVLWASATVGALAGGFVGQRFGTTPGRASLMGSGALWSGAVAGLGVYALSGEGHVGLLASALALNAGVLAALVVGQEVEPSVARVRFIDFGALSGGLVFGGLYLALSDDDGDSRGATASLALGLGTGLVTGYLLTRHMEPDEPRRQRGTFSMMPVLGPTPDGRGGTLGVGGAF